MENKKLLQIMRRKLWLMGLFKIPLIAYVQPKLEFIDEKECKIRIHLRRRTRNHLNSMYFGALAVGADIAAGLHAFYFAEQSNARISFAFKAVKGEFLKRPTSHVLFHSKQGELVKNTFEKAIESNERINEWITVEVINDENEIVALFEMQISIKVKS